MASNEPSKPEKSPEQKEKESEAAIGAMILAVTFKYLPVVLLGILFGVVSHKAARGRVKLPRIKTITLSLLFFAAPVFFLFGIPLPGLPRHMVSGYMARSPELQDLVGLGLKLWNNEFPKLPIIKVLRFSDHVTFYDVSVYFALSVVVALAYVVLCEIIGHFRPGDPTQRIKPGKLDFLWAMPERAIDSLLSIFLVRWSRAGRAAAWQIKESGIRAFLSAVFSMVILTVGALLLIGYGLPKLIPTELVDIVGYLALGPDVGFGLGFGLGAVDFVTHGRSLLSKLFKPKGDEFFLGTDFQGNAFGLSEKNLSYHVEVIAPTGSGKTNLLKNLIADRIHRGHGLIFLDLKAEFQVVSWMMRAATDASRDKEIRLVSLANRELSVPYNPIKMGTAPEIHSQLMNSMSWSEDYYRKISSIALMTLLRGLCEYRDRTGELFHLGHLYELLNEPGALRAFGARLATMQCPVTREIEQLAERMDRSAERDKLTGLVANLGLLIHSAAGPLVSEDVTRGSFDFREAVDSGRITYVLMNSMKLKETASVFGKMILQDLIRLVGDRYAEIDANASSHRPVTLIIDEFAAFAIPEFIEFMDRARGAGIGIVLAHQSRADLRAVSPEFQDRVEVNSNTVIVSGVKSSEDAEYYAGILGTRTVVKETTQAKDGLLGMRQTGMKSLREVEEYVVHPNRLKDLQQGEVFAVSRTVDARWGILKVPQADEYTSSEIASSELLTRLKKIRAQYQEEGREKYLKLEAEAARPGLTKTEARDGAGFCSREAVMPRVGEPPADPVQWN